MIAGLPGEFSGTVHKNPLNIAKNDLLREPWCGLCVLYNNKLVTLFLYITK